MTSKGQAKSRRGIAELRARLEESEETLRAIRKGEVDALVVTGNDGDRIYTLQGADRSYRTLLETMSEGAATLAPDGGILYCNSQFAKLLQTAQQTLIGASLFDFLPAGRDSEFQAFLDKRTENGARKEMNFCRADGSTVTVLVAVNALHLEGAESISLVATDLTERKTAEEQLRRAHDQLEERVRERTAELTQSEEKYRNLFESIDEGFCIVEVIFENTKPVDYWFVEVNPSFAKQTGIQNATGRRMRDIAPQHEQFWFDIFGRVAQTGQPVRFEKPSEALGRYYDVYAFRVGKPEQRRIALLLNDITERRQAQEVLARSNEELEFSVQERTAKLQAALGELEHFSYTITHDMRAPLRAMRGYGELLLEETRDIKPSSRLHVERICTAAERMDNLIIDALNYSKLARQSFELSPIDPGALLQGMIDSYPAFQEPNARFFIRKLPLILANEACLTQCFSNLLSNAVKFVGAGKTPQVHIWSQETGEHVRIWIEDNGIGIPADCLKKIFGMFQRVSQTYEGTGIGLALVRKAAERMGATVGVESEVGKGSRFWLECKKPAEAAPAVSKT